MPRSLWVSLQSWITTISDTGANLQPTASNSSSTFAKHHAPGTAGSASRETSPKDLMQNSSHWSLSDDGYRPEFPKTHAEFKSFIIRHIKQVGWIYCAINHHWCISRDIPVMSYRGQIYRMKPSGDALRHTTPKGKGPGTMTFYRQIRQKGGDVFPSLSALNIDHPFYALGFLVEPSNEKAGRETNYVWAINISTKPWSLWLIYDYVSWEFDGTKPNNDVRQIYKKTWSADRGLSYTYDRLESPYLGLERDWDMLKVLDDFDSWDPDNPCRVTLSDVQHGYLGPSLRAHELLNPYKRAVSTSELSQASSA
ncbi:MAG: hypothetical protein L6R38_004379 [Xanthoria sp. 2 TBL-2021]|nr:MAG: hypothetical protein L6R38_004379 [Xanthoria sp. 2 TBL-2021]